jgi:hypothetical protein
VIEFGTGDSTIRRGEISQNKNRHQQEKKKRTNSLTMIHASTQTKKRIVSSDWFSLPIVSICDLKSPVVNKSGWEKKQ